VILSGETLPPDFQQTVAFDFLDTFSFNSGRTLDSASGGQLAIIAQNINGGALLKGTSRPFPYTDLSSPGASQLEQIVNANQSTVPGLDESSFFSEIDDVQITNNNVVWFRGIAENSAGQVNDHSGIWNAVPGSVAVPVINYSIEFSVDAQRVSLTDIDSYFVNEQGDVLVRGEFLDPEDSDFFRRQVLIYQRGAF